MLRLVRFTTLSTSGLMGRAWMTELLLRCAVLCCAVLRAQEGGGSHERTGRDLSHMPAMKENLQRMQTAPEAQGHGRQDSSQ